MKHRAYESMVDQPVTLLRKLKQALRTATAIAAKTQGAGVLLCCVAVVLALAPLKPGGGDLVVSVKQPIAAPTVVPTGVAPQSGRHNKVELISIRPDGFSPRQITRAQGPVLIAINNRSGFSEPTLRLDRVAGVRLREVQVAARKVDWRGVVELLPGEYVLTEASHPNWSCTITVTQ